MNPRRGFGILGILAVLALAGIVAVISYNAGVSAGITTGAAATTVVVSSGAGLGILWILPLLFLGFLFVAMARAGRHARHAWGGGWSDRGGDRHGMGHGMGHGTDGTPKTPDRLPPFVEPMLADWHRRAHVGTDAPAGQAGMPGGTVGPDPTPPGPAAG